MNSKHKKSLSQSELNLLLDTLKTRFTNNMIRHKNIEWAAVENKLKDNQEKCFYLNEMEKTGGEPDVIGFENKLDTYLFCDCSAESPVGRRSLCYDKKAYDQRKENKPRGNAMDTATAMGIEMLSEEQYFNLQKLGKFDSKTSTWLKTPDGIRQSGGAIFGDFRYGNVFIYHNGAESYYAARGFRGLLWV